MYKRKWPENCINFSVKYEMPNFQSRGHKKGHWIS